MTDLAQTCATIRQLSQGLRASTGRPVRIMEICGTHTVSISRSGLRAMLGDDLSLVSGPGCPVCVTDGGYIDLARELALRKGFAVATYGDMVRVPGSQGSLADARADGADVNVVYAAHQAVALAAARPGRQVVFLGIGFETTAPASALAIKRARRMKLDNFSVLSAHKLVPPAMTALLDDPRIGIDGFLCPGHVSVIIGSDAYEPIVRRYGRPCVTAGFEPVNIAAGLLEIFRQLSDGVAAVGNVYPPVGPHGNTAALGLLKEVFRPCDARWRAIGVIPASGLAIADEFTDMDAFRRFNLSERHVPDPPDCRCGQVITGQCAPTDCPLFGSVCTPRSPIGPCMVSSEGSCAAFYKYHRRAN